MKNIFQKLHTLLRNCSEAIQRPIIKYLQLRRYNRDRKKRGYTCLTYRLNITEDDAINEHLKKKFDNRRPMRVHTKEKL